MGFQHLPCLLRAVGLVGFPRVPQQESQDVGHHSCHCFDPLTESVGAELGDLGFAVGLCQVWLPWPHPP